jgi:broad specificity phosphatase PhoE
MKIYLIRHGEVENPNKILYGRLPGFHLSAKGIVEIQQLAEKLKNGNMKISKIYTSPLERAVESAEIIAKVLEISPENIVKDNRINEINPGKWQGCTLEEFHKNYSQIRQEKGLGDPSVTGAKVLSLINDISKNDKDYAIVTHWDPIIAVVSLLRNDWNFFQNGYIKTGDYFVLDNSSGNWRVEDENLLNSTRANHR